MMKKISVWLLCVACLLTAATSALAEGESSETDAVISDTDVLPSEEPPITDPSEDEVSVRTVRIGTDFSDNVLLIFVTDELGNPVPNAPLAFDVGSTLNLLTVFTTADGTASMSIGGLDPGTVIVCHTAEFSTETVTYLSSEVTVNVPGEVPTTTTADDDTSTTETEPPTAPTAVTTLAPLPTLPPEESTGTTKSAPSYAEVRGATTTHVRGDEVYTNLLIDEHLLEQFGYGIDRFDQVGRLVLDQATYATLTETYGSHLFGKLTTSALSDVTVDQIRTAKSGIPEFADSKPENAMALTFAASLQFLEDNGTGLPVTDAASIGSNLMFEFSLPVPKSMEHCKSFGIAMTGENRLTSLTPVTVRDGVISFRTPALGHFTLVGFTDGSSSGGSALGNLMWLLIGLGVLMFALMGFLIYRFFLRDRGDDPDDDPDGGDDGYDGSHDGDGRDGDGSPDGEAAADPAQPDEPDAPDTPDTPDEEPPLLAADDTPLDVEALKRSWIEEDKQVQAILRDVKRSSR